MGGREGGWVGGKGVCRVGRGMGGGKGGGWREGELVRRRG